MDVHPEKFEEFFVEKINDLETSTMQSNVFPQFKSSLFTHVQIITMHPEEVPFLLIHYSFHDTVYGETLIASTEEGICFIGFGDPSRTLKELKEGFASAHIKKGNNEFQLAAQQAINQMSADESICVHACGTPFQLKVWQALLDVPVGETATYGDIAEVIGHSKAVRAVGTAVGKNPVAVLIPCHRIICSNGDIGNYHWGVNCKKDMITREKNWKRLQ